MSVSRRSQLPFIIEEYDTASNLKTGGDYVQFLTLLSTLEDSAYLVVVIDLYSPVVLLCQLADNMKAELVCKVVKAARSRR